jgi:phosphoribosylformylglycinamidine synthase subunit PurL
VTGVQVAAPTDAELAEVALTRTEYAHLAASLAREPNRLELGIVGALWSEHCSYKTSKPLLGSLPTKGPLVLQGPGENAGAVDIGHGLACVFKIESHNHPSAIEPYQGAATGVGGILRDIFTMGARPIALLDSLRFGPLVEPHQRHLFDGVVAGIGGYGNCIGVPTVGGELYFDDCYRANCLVNAMCVGVVEHGRMVRATASGTGNLVLLVGADTGRDGIHGASFASVVLDASSAARRPAVQVGNPFLEKCLMEACLELAGDPRVIAMQDLGAAGLCGSTAELAHRGGRGIEVDVARASRRESGMTPYEVMLSESQERMLIVARPGDVRSLQAVFERWDLHSDVVGVILEEPRFVVRDGPERVCDLPLDLLVDGAPPRGAPGPRPPRSHLRGMGAPEALFSNPVWTPGETLLALLGSPNLGSRMPVYRRYDHQLGDSTVVLPGGDAALVRVEGTSMGLAMATDGNARYTSLDARQGAMIAVCEAARNVVATGARPVAITNCLNFANPEQAPVWWDLHDAIDGIGEACRALEIPVVSGNVSLYNDTGGTGIDPTVVIGMVGVIDDVTRRCTAGFGAEGDRIALVGPIESELGGSEYQSITQGLNRGSPPNLDIDLERRVHGFVLDAISAGLLHSAHDCAEGGIAVALAESCLLGDIGASVDIDELGELPGSDEMGGLIERQAGILFGESQSRFLISFAGEALVRLHELAGRYSVPLRGLGSVAGERLCVTGCIDVPLLDVRRAHEGALIERE